MIFSCRYSFSVCVCVCAVSLSGVWGRCSIGLLPLVTSGAGDSSEDGSDRDEKEQLNPS